MLLIPFVSSFMIASFILGTHLAILATTVLIVYYLGHPLVQYISMIHFERIDIFLFIVYAVVIAIMIYKFETTANDFDSISAHLALKDARIRELEMELNKTRMEEGRRTDSQALYELSNPVHRMCHTSLFQRE